MSYVDLALRLTGGKVPVDHGYVLCSAISRLVPEIHEAKKIGVHPIRRTYSGNGELMLRDSSRLVLRLESEQIGQFLKLAGKKLEMGNYSVRVGIPEVRLLRPRASLYSRLVTIKGFMDPGGLWSSFRGFSPVARPAARDIPGSGRSRAARFKAWGLPPGVCVQISIDASLSNINSRQYSIAQAWHLC